MAFDSPPNLYSQALARSPLSLRDYRIAAVIPAYNEEANIARVLRSLPPWLAHIIVVEDCGRDKTADVVEELAKEDPRIILIRHEQNQGVGGAMVTGFKKALELEAQIVVKLDGDGQMNPDHLVALLRPLIAGEADYAKGNRFHDFRALSQMPPLRRAGNMGLSFLTKAAVGYWNCFDPCNGFVAIRGEVLAALPLDKIHRSYFFETSMLSRLYLLGAAVKDVPMPARYAGEHSSLSISRVLLEFPPKLAYSFVRRMLLKNYIYDFSMESLYLIAAFLFLAVGIGYGGWNWLAYARLGDAAPTGTVVIPAMLIILGFQILLSAIGEDLRNVPKVPLCSGPLAPDMPVADSSPLVQTAEATSRSDAAPAYADVARREIPAAAMVQGSKFKVQS
ncbi:MAG: glycosyltransferase family 2 protein [Pirellulaceae bacterium]